MITKKIIRIGVVIATLLHFSAKMNAQEWCPAGATWYYTSNGDFGEGYTKFTYTNDTIIKGITCKKITHYYRAFGFAGVYEIFGPSKYAYSDNGVVYQYNNSTLGRSKFDTVYNINAKIGDKWHLPQVDTSCVDSMYRMEVLNIGTKTINGFNLKWLYVKIGAIEMGGPKFYVFDTITERLGLVTDGFMHLCNPGFTESSQYELRCYSDNSFGSYSTGISKKCDYITAIKESKPDKIDIGLYPNPANNKISIQLYSNPAGMIELKLYDLTGRLVQSKSFNKDTDITTSLLDTGVYTYTCTMNGYYLKSGKITIIH